MIKLIIANYFVNIYAIIMLKQKHIATSSPIVRHFYLQY